ncbi:MAG TPA: glycosyltransferase family 1 protein, partial [Stellaceae bacterium]|nr:glycosyltransferase family 1 protein [Stellaceae bacterium]
MASIVMADDGIAFDGKTAEEGPLGGVETAFTALAEAFAARGHHVKAHSRCTTPLEHRGVNWVPVDTAPPRS